MADDIFTVQRKPLSWQEMTRQAMVEEARRQAPMGWEVPVDQLYAPSSDVPVSGGFAPGGAEYDPTPEMIASMVPWGAMTKGAIAELKGLDEVGAIGPGVKDLIAKNINKRINMRAGVQSRLNSRPKLDAAREQLSDIISTGQFEPSKSFEKYIGQDVTNLMSALDDMPARKIEEALEHNYQGGVTQFLKDYRNEYGPKMYHEYLRASYGAQTPEAQALWGDIVKNLEKELKSSGVHLDTALERLLIK